MYIFFLSVHIVFVDDKIKIRALGSSKLFDSKKDQYYIENREWIVKQESSQILIAEQSLEILAPDSQHPRIFNPLILLKVRKSFNEYKANPH